MQVKTMGHSFELYDCAILAEGDLDLLQNLRKEMKSEYEDEVDSQRFVYTKSILTDLSRRLWDFLKQVPWTRVSFPVVFAS